MTRIRSCFCLGIQYKIFYIWAMACSIGDRFCNVVNIIYNKEAAILTTTSPINPLLFPCYVLDADISSFYLVFNTGL